MHLNIALCGKTMGKGDPGSYGCDSAQMSELQDQMESHAPSSQLLVTKAQRGNQFTQGHNEVPAGFLITLGIKSNSKFLHPLASPPPASLSHSPSQAKHTPDSVTLHLMLPLPRLPFLIYYHCSILLINRYHIQCHLLTSTCSDQPTYHNHLLSISSHCAQFYFLHGSYGYLSAPSSSI